MTNKTSEAGADIEALCRGVLSLEGSTTWKTHYEIARACLAQQERLRLAEAVIESARKVQISNDGSSTEFFRVRCHYIHDLYEAIAAWKESRDQPSPSGEKGEK